jgi:hypothetical protein
MDTALLTASITLVGFFVVNFIAEDFRRFRNGSSVAAGLAGELASYKEAQALLDGMITSMINAVKEGVREHVPFRSIDPPKDRIFDANVANLGLLGPELVEQIAFVYGQIYGFRVSFALVHSEHKEMSDAELTARLTASQIAVNRASERGNALVEQLKERAGLSFRAWAAAAYLPKATG